MAIRRIDSRGFTLFTALVAFILIVLTILLVQSMVSTERSYSETISDISNQEEMQAIADLTRADALQVFNFSIRQSIESFSTHEDEGLRNGLAKEEYFVFPDQAASWEEMKARFVADRFGVGNAKTNQFAIYAARSLISMLSKSQDARGFHIEIKNPDEAGMSEVLKGTFEKQDIDDFFQIINCDITGGATYKNCTGSFYITMNLDGKIIDDITYEKFPRVIVENDLTGRKLDEPILPRGKFRIFVPTRLFKALAGAREVACANGGGALEDDFISGMGTMISKSAAEDGIRARILPLLTDKMANESDGMLLNSYNVLAETQTTVVGGATEENLVGYQVVLYFKEGNPKYIVSAKPPNTASYAIRLIKRLDTHLVKCG